MTDDNDFEITPGELADRLEGGEAVQVLDSRAPQRLAAGKVEARPGGVRPRQAGGRRVRPRESGCDTRLRPGYTTDRSSAPPW